MRHTVSRIATLVLLALLCRAATFHYDHSGSDWTGTCATGTSQSPIALTQVAVDTSLRAMSFADWGTSASFLLLNNGHTIQVQDFATPSYFTDPNSGIQYQLAQFHFHSPSEHVWGSGVVDLEVHMVHVRVGGSSSVGDDLLVIGIGLTSSEFSVNRFLNTFWTDLAAVANHTGNTTVAATLNMQEALPKGKNYATYSGSLTTPPCTEGVHWYVMESRVMLARSQVEFIREALDLNATVQSDFYFEGNRRAPQPLNGRVVRGFSAEAEATLSAASRPEVLNQRVEAEALFATILSCINFAGLIVVLYAIKDRLPCFGASATKTQPNSV